MNQPLPALVRAKFRQFESFIRRKYFALLGLKMSKGGNLGKISCDWPANLSIGENCNIEDNVHFRIAYPFSKRNIIKIGNRVFVGRSAEFNCTSMITIGDDCMIASDTKIIDVGHHTVVSMPMNQQPEASAEIRIGNDVWIGSGAIILKGTILGNGCIIGAGSVVNKSIPDYEIWAGVPARFIRNR